MVGSVISFHVSLSAAEIDSLMYELYGLTEEEIGVVEGLDHE